MSATAGAGVRRLAVKVEVPGLLVLLLLLLLAAAAAATAGAAAAPHPDIRVTPAAVAAGDVVHVSGDGFEPGPETECEASYLPLVLQVGGIQRVPVPCVVEGHAIAALPGLRVGEYEVLICVPACDDAGTSPRARGRLPVAPAGTPDEDLRAAEVASMTFRPAAPREGDRVRADAPGLPPAAPVPCEIAWDGTPVTAATCAEDARGGVDGSFPVPRPSSEGAHTVAVCVPGCADPAGGLADAAVTVSAEPPSRIVPYLVGGTDREARRALGRLGLVTQVDGEGTLVAWQEPLAGSRVPVGSTVSVSLRPAERTQPPVVIVVPDLSGLGPDDVRDTLSSVGLEAAVPEAAQGTVAVGQDPSPGTRVPPRSTVEVALAPPRQQPGEPAPPPDEPTRLLPALALAGALGAGMLASRGRAAWRRRHPAADPTAAAAEPVAATTAGHAAAARPPASGDPATATAPVVVAHPDPRPVVVLRRRADAVPAPSLGIRTHTSPPDIRLETRS